MTIPLLDADENYELYDIHNLAFPDPFVHARNSDTDMMASIGWRLKPLWLVHTVQSIY